MKRNIVIGLLLVCISGICCAQNNSFNYNKWKAEQEAKNNPSKAKTATTEFENLLRPTYLYAEPMIQCGSFRGPGIAVGGSYSNVNVEANFVYGLVESYQIKRFISNTYHGYTYRPYSFGIKAGYNFNYAGCLQITPQVGVKHLCLYGERDNEVSENASETGTVECLTVGVHLNYAFTRHLALAVTPEYSVAVGKSDLYNTLVEDADGGDDIRRWAENLNVRVGLNIMF